MRNLLIVDDEIDLRESLEKFFSKKGFNVQIAENGQEAFEHFLKSSYDVLISDVRMAKGGGLELMEKINKQPKPLPKIIFITGYSEVDDNEVLARGAFAVIHKPFSRNDLLEIIEKALASE